MDKTYKTLSLDLGTYTGWAVGIGGHILSSGTESFFVKGEVHPGYRYQKFHNWLVDLIHRENIGEIFYENIPRYESVAAARVHAGFLGIMNLVAFTAKLPMYCLKPNTIKMIFTGKGNAKKIKMCAVAHALGWRGGHLGTEDSNNEADAIAIYYSIMQRHRHIDVTVVNRQATNAEHWVAKHGISDNHPVT